MNKLVAYCKESYFELVNKVTWPTWKELQSSAVVVMIASMLIALTIWLMDVVSDLILNKGFYDLFSY